MDEQQSQAALSPTRGDTAPAFRAPAAIDAGAAAQLALTGGDPDEALVRLTNSLRAGLAGPRLRDGVLTVLAPIGADPFDFYASPEAELQDDATVQLTQDLPKEALSAEPAAAAAAAHPLRVPALLDGRVALIVQDMAGFGAIGRETARIATPADAYRLDYFA